MTMNATNGLGLEVLRFGSHCILCGSGRADEVGWDASGLWVVFVIAQYPRGGKILATNAFETVRALVPAHRFNAIVNDWK